jgi:hypothetical protein
MDLLLANAIESIQVGVEDYQAATRPRLLSAVRNIHAGILLLYKEALRRESPPGSNDALMMAKIAPSRDTNGNLIFVGVGKKTADTQQIRERFESLGIETDWKRFERINEARNDVEHLYPRLDQKGLEGLISNSFLLVRDFIANELDDDPRKLLGAETWQAMLEVAEVYQKESDECRRLVDEANWPAPALKEGVLDLTCPSCSGDLLKPEKNSYDEIILKCISCGAEQSPDSYVPKALASALSADAYIAMKDGGDPPVVSCPECGEEAFLTEEWRCAVCGAEPEGSCARCGNAIPPEELDSSPLCGYCEHMSNKND